MNKRVIFWIKVVVLVAVAGFVLFGKGGIVDSWNSVAWKKMTVDWRWGPIAVLGFCASMLTSSLVWVWLARRMGGEGVPARRLVGAYIFSQLGKYIPGKVGLLLIRIERAGRFGLGAGVCTLSTLLENALYIISGGLVSMMAVVRILAEVRARGIITEAQQRWQWPMIVAAIVVLAVVCYPPVFYGVVNRVMRKLKKPQVARERQLGMGTLALAVAGFVPCWIFGGLALWASTMCVHRVDLLGCGWFTGAFALSVILGMVSLLPGGIGVRELVLGVAVTLQLSPEVGHEQAVGLGIAAAGLQRLFQVIAEVVMGGLGAAMTSGGRDSELKVPNSQ
jgi:glycosyltransferase 2 family protein